jgi:calcium-dependent protein kinase
MSSGQNVTDYVGTLPYFAPEVFLNPYGTAVDVWSLGVVMYLLLSGRYPFTSKSANEAASKI